MERVCSRARSSAWGIPRLDKAMLEAVDVLNAPDQVPEHFETCFVARIERLARLNEDPILETAPPEHERGQDSRIGM